MTYSPEQHSGVLEDLLGPQSPEITTACTVDGLALLRRLERAAAAACLADNGLDGYRRALVLTRMARQLLKFESEALDLFRTRRTSGPHWQEDAGCVYRAYEAREHCRARAENLLKAE